MGNNLLSTHGKQLLFIFRSPRRPERGSKRSVRLAQAQIGKPHPDPTSPDRFHTYRPTRQRLAEKPPAPSDTDIAIGPHPAHLEVLRVNEFRRLAGIQTRRWAVSWAGVFIPNASWGRWVLNSTRHRSNLPC